MEKLFLAADSGGSKTVWSLIDSTGAQVFSFKTEGLGAVKEGILPVEKTVKTAAENISKVGVPCSIHLSLGGPNTDEVYNALKTAWPGIPIKVEREASGDSILLGAKYLGCTSAVMCGTGSTAVGNTKSGRRYCGGWGPIYGDGGSGGGLGSDALKIFLKKLDKENITDAFSSIFTGLTQGLNISDFYQRMEVKSRALGLSRRELASLAPKIYNLAVNGDDISKKLYEEAADAVAEMAFTVSDNDENTKVLLCGGFFAEKPWFLNLCCEKFAKLSWAQLYFVEDFSPIIGVKLSVLKNSNIEITENILKEIMKG